MRQLGPTGRDDPAEEAAKADSLPTEASTLAQIEAPGASLNMRRWPSFNPNVIASIPDGTIVSVNRAGSFGGRVWLNVTFDGRDGWIVATYATHIPLKPARSA